MTLEWLRRRYPALDAQMRTYLFTEGDILAAKEKTIGEDDGQDFSIGYTEHNETHGRLYIQESFTSLRLGPEAAVPLRHG